MSWLLIRLDIKLMPTPHAFGKSSNGPCVVPPVKVLPVLISVRAKTSSGRPCNRVTAITLSPDSNVGIVVVDGHDPMLVITR